MSRSEAAEAVAAASGGSLILSLHDRIAELRLSRPEKLNAINRSILAGFRAAIAALADDTSIGAVVIAGEGRAFSAGGDLEEVAGLVRDRELFDGFLDEWHATLDAIEAWPVPTVAAVHGIAFAGGFELTQVCDVVVAGDRTRLGDQHANFGLFPAGGSTQRLPRLVGPRLSTWMLLSGEAIDPEQALAAGLVTEVVAEQSVHERAHELAGTLARRSADANAAIKAAILRGRGLSVADAIDAERELALTHMASDDVQTGLAAFRARTVPEFHTRED